MSQPSVFDAEHYKSLNASRVVRIGEVLGELRPLLGLHTAADIGCGVGYFSAYLESLGFVVSAVDGRKENVEETKKRVPKASVAAIDAEDPALNNLGRFDLVLCLGLLYHLENPFRTIRSLYRIAGNLLIAESVIFPGSEPIMGLVDEGQAEDQGLNYIAFYPTEACLVKMMYRAGFLNVYRFTQMPEHQDFQPPPGQRRVRTILAASNIPLNSRLLEKMLEPRMPIVPWVSNPAQERDLIKRLWRFAGMPLPEKIKAAKFFFGR